MITLVSCELIAVSEPDFTHHDVIRDPYPALAALREAGPVVWNHSLRSWCIARYDDVTQAYSEPRLISGRIGEPVSGDGDDRLQRLVEHLKRWMVFTDPPDHTRLRKLTQRAFSKKYIETRKAQIATRANHLIDQLYEHEATDTATSTGTARTIDFVQAFAWPLPALVIADFMGVPSRHIEDLKRWSDDLGQFVLSSRRNENRHQQAADALEKMTALFRDVIRERREIPGTDLIDELITAHDVEDQLSEDELIAFCVLLLFAGHETTAHFFSSSLRALIHAPDQYDDLKEHANDANFVSAAVQELMRFDGPILAISRTVRDSVVYGGTTLNPGERVYLFNAAANRDAAQFHEPDRLNLRRQDADRMVGFGYGIHLCLGIHLARLEAQVGLPLLLNRLVNPRLVEEPLWADTLVVRGPAKMMIQIDGVRA